MPDQIYIGNLSKGLTTNRLPFAIDNDAFPTMYNFYCWRGRVKRKRGTSLLGRLQIQVQSVLTSTPPASWQKGTISTLSGGAGSFNLLTFVSASSSASIVPLSISLSDGVNTYIEPATPNGTLVGSPAGSGTINYTTGAVTISGGSASGPIIGTFSYFTGIPVMGLEDLNLTSTPYPFLLDFDLDYSYQFNSNTNSFYNVSFYKNSNNPVIWNGADFQQFWSTNYQDAFWATNNVPGFHFVNGTYTSGTGTPTITFNFQSLLANYTKLVVGDYLWFNEWTTGGVTINGLTGRVTTATDAANGNYVVTFSGNQTVSGTGIVQLLTASLPGQDGIRWYDGDPTSGTGLPTVTGTGWVNFAPALTANNVSIDDEPLKKYYLVGALAILPFKDRIIFFSPYIQAADGSPPIRLPDVALWSWNGTPYYSDMHPANQSSDNTAFYVDQTGKGGWLAAGISQDIVTINNNEDVLLVGFTGKQTRFVYTGNDINPFLFFSVNSELGSSATFSGVTLDQGGLTIGTYGIAMTDQQSSQRIDLAIPDQVFDIQALNNGAQRVSGQRDFFREWIYFSYPITDQIYADGATCKFPLQTFLFNYRDNTWAILYENFTSHGTYRQSKSNTWASIGAQFGSWENWLEPWNSAATQALFPSVIGGNPQGYVLIKGIGTGEAQSGSIGDIVDSGGLCLITSINHCVSAANPTVGNGDYIYIQNCIGAAAVLNGVVTQVKSTPTANTFTIDLPFPGGTYLGLGTFSRLSVPLLQTKQFNPYWEQGKKVRLGVQKYLMDFTENGQITVNINLSQDPDNVYNAPANDAIVYSQLLYTCPESQNIGLTPANTNLQMPTAASQYQIWHRFNTSLIGDSFQIGLTLSDEQMRNIGFATNEIVLQAASFEIYPSQQLC